MQYATAKPVFNYPIPFPHDDYGQQSSWDVRHRMQPTIAPRTVTPGEVLRRTDTYYDRSYEPEQRYSSGSGRHSAEAIYMIRSENTTSLPLRQPRRYTEVDTDRSMVERPSYTVEVVPQTSKSQRFFCEDPECVDPDTGVRRSVGRKADLRRHMASVHGKPYIDCEYKRCARKGDQGFCRHDHYRDHLRHYHNQEVVRSERRRDS